jgi:hypothetical protein
LLTAVGLYQWYTLLLAGGHMIGAHLGRSTTHTGVVAHGLKYH